jgi:type II secretory ATPase GspE/PulE/Tfp pilus assembly ATPase PilB-like protein
VLLPHLLSKTAEDFMLENGQAVFRVQRSSQAIGGTWFRLRRVLRARPTLQTLPSRLGSAVEAALLCLSLSGGGLLLVLGAPGSGKTTTASAVVASHLQQFGGYGYTIEDPPEIMGLSGRHGPLGFCVQHQVFDFHDGWERSIKQLLRGQPLGSPLILLVGDIRITEAARMIIHAASNGFLGFATSFAFDMVSGIDALLQLAGTEHAASLSHVFRVAVFQSLISGNSPQVRAQHLGSHGGSSRVAVVIRCARLSMLRDELVINVARQVR